VAAARVEQCRNRVRHRASMRSASVDRALPPRRRSFRTAFR
jgi:hypothetical protein